MEGFDGSGLAVVGCSIKKKRSNLSRRPRVDSRMLLERIHLLPLSTEIYSNVDNDTNQNNGDRVVVADGLGSDNKLKKLKFKVGGVTHTIQTKSTAYFAYGGGTVTRKSTSLTADTAQEKLLPQDGITGNYSYSSDKGKGFGVTDSVPRREHSSRGIPVNHEFVRKSNRVPKRRVLDVGLNEDDDEDEEIRYLERLRASKNPGGGEDGKDYRNHKEHLILKVQKIRLVMDGLSENAAGDYGSPRLRKDCRKKSRSEKEFEDIDYGEEEEETISDEEPGSTGKKLKKGSPSQYVGAWKESTPTTRNRAAQHGKDNLNGSSASSIDLSNYLLSSKSRRKTEKLSELEQQSKKAEAAQRRRLQSEKAAREAEAEAIRKILGQDSGRKKREEKMKKQRDELIQGRAANALTLASNTVRWVNNPTGTIVTFSEDIGLPSLFSPALSSYPPPREKCAGPNCTNAYKYRDSKSNLPLCSLQCYKAIHNNLQPLVTC
ncbi:INO80 complex, subunit Ies [Parasponia andersonii]|uniref:INO80 complex, subunit Ies n=1 Tax=Parasponia andersonii TaxID=3476 RepID=A0A2P5CV85_PARAD|nr:INO80 complex, subunit Ies [Parasponia andersonii]